MISKQVVVFGLMSVSAAHDNQGHKSYQHRRPSMPVGAVPPSAETLVAEGNLPQHFDWRDVNGKSYVTTDWNQHIPQYCGACWVHGTTSALNDRIKAMRGAKFPDVMLGRQAIVNCVPDPEGEGPPPGCNGGEAWMIHKYVHENGIPDESCLPYQAQNMGCSAENVCRNCAKDGAGCWPVKNYVSYSVSSYGKVRGEKAMMKEIYARGPIVCSFATDDDFMYKYSETVMQQEGVYFTGKKYNMSDIDHDMEVAGWGETPSGLKYWVVRNSWGTYWGEAGWLKLRRGTNELLSEIDCDWAVPTFDDMNTVLAGKALGDYVQGDLSLQETAERIPGKVLGQEALASVEGNSADVPIFAVASVAFVAGVSVAALAVKVVGHARVRQQPFILG